MGKPILVMRHTFVIVDTYIPRISHQTKAVFHEFTLHTKNNNTCMQGAIAWHNRVKVNYSGYIRSMNITLTSYWAEWRLKSPESPLFTQPFIQAQIKETSKFRVTGLCEGNSPVTGEFPVQMVSNAETFPFDDVIMNRSGGWKCSHILTSLITERHEQHIIFFPLTSNTN